MPNTHEHLKELALLMIDYEQDEEKRLETVEAILDIWEASPAEEGLTSLEFKEGWANIHSCMESNLIGFGVLSKDETTSLAMWKRMVQQVVRHDGTESLYRTLQNHETFKPVHLDVYLEHGLDLFSPQRQAALSSVVFCKAKAFFPQLLRFIEEGKIDLLARSTCSSEFGNIGGFLLRESRHPAYVKAVLETGIHPDELWTASSYLPLPNQGREYLCATAFQYLCNDFAGKFEYQFSTFWNEDWYKPYVEVLTLLLEHGADYNLVHPNSPHGYPSALQALDAALDYAKGKTFDAKWKPCVDAAHALRAQFYDHRLHQHLSQASDQCRETSHVPKPRI